MVLALRVPFLLPKCTMFLFIGAMPFYMYACAENTDRSSIITVDLICDKKEHYCLCLHGVYVCVYPCDCEYTTEHMWVSEDDFVKLVLSSAFTQILSIELRTAKLYAVNILIC